MKNKNLKSYNTGDLVQDYFDSDFVYLGNNKAQISYRINEIRKGGQEVESILTKLETLS